MIMKRCSIIVLILLTSFCFAGPSTSLNRLLLKKIVNLEFRATDIKDVLRLISRQYGLNLVISSEIKGEVSLSLNNVSLQDALTAILNANGFHYVVENDILLVKALNRSVLGELDSRVYKLHYTDAIDVLETVNTLLTAKGSAQVMHLVKTEEVKEMRSDILVVSDLPENLNRIDKIIDQIDVPQQLVLIEVRLIETLLSEDQKFGFDWPDKIGTKISGADPSRTITADYNGTFDSGENPNAGYMPFPPQNNSFKWGILTVSEMEFTLNMLAKDENSKLVSNPHITTLNNKQAVIRVGTTIPIPEVNRSAAGDLISYKDKQIDVELNVIPRIEPDNKIQLTVHPSIEEIIGYTGPGDFPQPITSVREVETVVSVTPEETLVLGGMVKETKKTVENKVWLLGDIPLLGALFRSTEETVKKTDLLIFITPKLVTETAAE